jgi:hypothetical protein
MLYRQNILKMSSSRENSKPRKDRIIHSHRQAVRGYGVKSLRAVAQMMLATIIHSSYKHGKTN